MTQPPPYGSPSQPSQAGQPGQPAAGPQSAYAPPEYSEPVSRFNPVAAVLVVLGAAALLLAFTVLNWFRSDSDDASFFDDAGDDSTFGKLSKGFAKTRNGVPARYRDDLSFGVSDQYFGWLGWTLLAAAVVLAVLAILPLASGSAPLRVLAVLVSLAGIVLTAWALRLIAVSGDLEKTISTSANKFPSYGDYLKHSSFGAWAAVLGFALLIVAVLLPRRRQASRGY